MARIKKGDTVTVLSGKDKGKRGKVLAVWPEREQALVERLNLVKHFERRSQQHPSGGIIEREGPLALSKLSLLCSRCNKSARVGWLVTDDGAKQRVCCSCRSVI